MSDVTVPSGGRARLDRVEGDLDAGDKATIEPGRRGTTVVTGQAVFRGDATLLGPFECRRLDVRRGRLRAEASLTVLEDLQADRSSVEVRGRVRAGRTDVDRELLLHADAVFGRLSVGGVLEAEGSLGAESVHVGGSARVRGATKADTVSVGGTVELGPVDLASFDVGGVGTVAGGTIRTKVAVGGTFESVGALTFGRLSVGGTATLGGGSKGGKIAVGGTLLVRGDVGFDRLAVGGVAEIEGTGAGDAVGVGGQLRVGENLTLQGRFEVGGSSDVGGELAAGSLKVGGEFEARRASVRDDAQVGSTIRTDKGLWARRIEVARRAAVRGRLVAETVEIGRDATVEDVYGASVQVGSGARVGAIHADEVDVGRDAQLGRVEYVRTLRLGPGATVARTPIQVNERAQPSP